MNNKKIYEQPFAAGTLGCQRFRIPAIITLKNSSVMAAADLRYNDGADSPNNLDSLVAVSADGYKSWQYNKVNYFDDYDESVTEKDSASFIDCALVQSNRTDRIFILADAWTGKGGYPTVKKGTGYKEIDGKKRLILTDGSTRDELSEFKYYIGDFEEGFARIYKIADSTATSYSVDEEYVLYKDNKPLYQKQVGSNKDIKQTVFYERADLKLYCTCYLWLRWSDDNGKTWSKPRIISEDVKNDNEAFLGVCPGRGLAIEHNGKERILYCVYDNSHAQERVSTIYSDDNGYTWHRGQETDVKKKVKKTSESQLVSLSDGTVRMFSRNGYDFVAFADSHDGGESFEVFRADTRLPARGNCMLSFINSNKKINGKNVVIGSYASNKCDRRDGVIKVGTVEKDNSIEWITTYHVNEDKYAYSCLTELPDGNIALLYEDTDTSIRYMILTMDEEGNLSEVNGENKEFTGKMSFKHKFSYKMKDLGLKINKAKDLI